jgi:hypothetical protein
MLLPPFNIIRLFRIINIHIYMLINLDIYVPRLINIYMNIDNAREFYNLKLETETEVTASYSSGFTKETWKYHGTCFATP